MNILITGAGGPSAISVWKSLKAHHRVFMADMDPCAAGLYLVSGDRRAIIPRGTDPSLVDILVEVCLRFGIEILVPTVDHELTPIAENEHRFREIGVRCGVSGVESLRLCADKHALLRNLASVVNTPRSELLTDAPVDCSTPLFAKPRVGAGSKGGLLVASERELATLPRDGSYLLQEFLPGTEYSVDVYRTADGKALASVVRERMKIDSGIAVAARTVHQPKLAEAAVTAACAADIRYVCNVQFRRDCENNPRLLEINPRFPGTLPLTQHAGIDLPAMLVAELSGRPPIDVPSSYREIMMVRYLEDVCVNIGEWEGMSRS